MTEKLDGNEIRKLKSYYAKRWLDPVVRMEDIFNVKRADGSLTPLVVPEPQKEMIQDGILGKSQDLVGSGVTYVGVTNKGRQLGFSVILAAENILIAEDYPGTNIYYIATARDQADDWMKKLDQLVRDANNWPEELGGGPIITIKNIEKVYSKNINGTVIVGLSANPPGIRGKTGISVVFDEAAWAIRFKGQARETWKALKYVVRQGGSARIQSTPRVSDDEEFFWGMYNKGEKGNMAIHSYYAPVITNWEELDLDEPLWICLNNERREKVGLRNLTSKEVGNLIERYEHQPNFEIIKGEHIKQNANIPYWWVSLEDLEADRASDIEQFKQENLGIPLDETYKVLKSDWIYGNLCESGELDDRGKSTNNFYMTIDLAQVNDLTVITITEKIDNVYVERKIVETQKEYPIQSEIIFDLFIKFRPVVISIDYTGHGIPITQGIEKSLQESGYTTNIIQRVKFTQQSKEQMAQGFRSIVMPDPLTGLSRYRWLYKEKQHENAIRHCMRVEKQLLPEGGTKYSGKMHGRDDHFWSKAQIALIDISKGTLKAAFGKRKITSMVDATTQKNATIGKSLVKELNAKRDSLKDPEEEQKKQKEYKTRYERIKDLKNLAFAIKCLSNGIIVCSTTGKPVKPIHCASLVNCRNPDCPGFKYVDEICERYGVEKNDVWKRQKEYPGKE